MLSMEPLVIFWLYSIAFWTFQQNCFKRSSFDYWNKMRQSQTTFDCWFWKHSLDELQQWKDVLLQPPQDSESITWHPHLRLAVFWANQQVASVWAYMSSFSLTGKRWKWWTTVNSLELGNQIFHFWWFLGTQIFLQMFQQRYLNFCTKWSLKQVNQ